MRFDEGQRAHDGNCSNSDPCGQRAIEHTFAKPARQPAQQVLANELTEKVVGEGNATGSENMKKDHACDLE